MHFPKSLLLAALAGGASVLPAAAATLLVPQQYPTVQKAVNAAHPGDTVQVSPKPKGGVYNEAVTIKTTGLTLQGVNGPVLDGTGLVATVTVTNPGGTFTYTTPLNDIDIQAAHVTVSGLTVQNSGASGINVGTTGPNGFDEVSYSDIEVSGCTIKNNAQGATLTGFTGSPYAQYGVGAPVVYLKGYEFTGNTVTGNVGTGAAVTGSGALVSGNTVKNNGGVAQGGFGADGLDVTGDGLTVTGNECSANGHPNYNYGLSVTGTLYDPAAKSHPAPSTVALNAVHDNTGAGVYLKGTLLVSGNVVDHNTAYGLFLDFPDYSVISGNSVTRTTSTHFGLNDSVSQDDGQGIHFLEGGYSEATGAFVLTGPTTISLNQVSGNAGDGIALLGVDDAQVTANSVTGNGQVGIHVSDFVYQVQATPKLPGNTLSYNYAKGNALFDAQDDATGVYNLYGSQDGLPATPNVWTRNAFGTTDPKNLSH